MKAVLPRFNLDLKDSFLEQKTYYVPPDSSLSYEIEWCLSFLLEEIAKTAVRRENLKVSLNDSADFNIREAFSLIDRENKKFLDSVKYFKFFIKNNYPNRIFFLVCLIF